MNNIEKRYDYINKVTQARGIRFRLFWQPFRWLETGYVALAIKQQEEVGLSKHQAIRHNFVVSERAMGDRLKDKPYCSDYQNVLCGRTRPADQNDGIHLLDGGREIVAAHMAGYLQAQPWRALAMKGRSQ